MLATWLIDHLMYVDHLMYDDPALTHRKTGPSGVPRKCHTLSDQSAMMPAGLS